LKNGSRAPAHTVFRIYFERHNIRKILRSQRAAPGHSEYQPPLFYDASPPGFFNVQFCTKYAVLSAFVQL